MVPLPWAYVTEAPIIVSPVLASMTLPLTMPAWACVMQMHMTGKISFFVVIIILHLSSVGLVCHF